MKVSQRFNSAKNWRWQALALISNHEVAFEKALEIALSASTHPPKNDGLFTFRQQSMPRR